MSRTQPNPTEIKNPAKKFLEWSSSDKSWKYYDKAAEKELSIPHADISFIVLDQLNTAKGFDEKAMSGIWANEVRNCKTETMTLRNKNGIIKEGPWESIKTYPGVKFAKSVYAMGKIAGSYELCNFQLSGAAVGAWFEFCETAGNLEGDIVICVTDVAIGKKGAVKFNVPVFSIVSRTLSSEAASLADDMDRELQEYLKAYFSKSQSAPQAESTAESAAYDSNYDEEAPF